MLKYRFLKNSAKVLSISTGILLLSNLILLLSLLIPTFVSKIGFLSKLPDLSIYIFTFFSYLALNDEKAAHRKIKDIKSQNCVRVLKGILITIFATHFFKGFVEKKLLGFNGSFSRFFLSIFLIVSAFSFFLMLVSLWFFIRDRKEGRVKYFSLISIMVYLFYLSYKLMLYHGIREESSVFYSETTQYIFCVIQYSVNILMFFFVGKHFERKEIQLEKIEDEKPKSLRPEVVDSIETEEGYGIDLIDDLKF